MAAVCRESCCLAGHAELPDYHVAVLGGQLLRGSFGLIPQDGDAPGDVVVELGVVDPVVVLVGTAVRGIALLEDREKVVLALQEPCADRLSTWT